MFCKVSNDGLNCSVILCLNEAENAVLIITNAIGMASVFNPPDTVRQVSAGTNNAQGSRQSDSNEVLFTLLELS